ncbi:hypothetical protein ACWEVY_34440 [Streptomyces longwoodensis]
MMRLGAAEGALRDDVPTAWLVEIYFTALSSGVRDRRTDETGAGLVVGLFLRGAAHDGVR